MKVLNINNMELSREIIAENDRFKTVYFKFEKGKGLAKHKHNGNATIQVISGEVNMEFANGNKFNLSTGDFLSFDARIEHNVIANIESKVLVTIAKAPLIKILKR
ncbi:Cupin domain [uncultured Clostridium sp.]|uniref:cupin domain-containing protein n=1 Tax=uncultured Clostridium sp. TaxID=59620 RepID=UPI00082124CB|nr:cupin domain-containing protein [uncultured Clostridium sp.]SCJ05326.1 Cupin domain [uncultured Clostridium sp.]